MSRVRITVTEEDIKKGKKGNSFSCPIALAVCRRFGVEAVFVAYGVSVYPNGSTTPRRYFSISSKAKDFITDFDAGLSVEPVTFYITEEP